MTHEEWCWAAGLGQLLGYRAPAPWSEGMHPMVSLLGRQKRHRLVTVRGPFGFESSALGPRPGWLRVQIGTLEAYAIRAQRDFDIAGPDSMEKAAEFVRSTYTKAQREWEERQSKKAPRRAS